MPKNLQKNNFKEQVIAIVKKIKEGETKTYKEVAVLAGNSKAARAVGTIMAKNDDLNVPCHRVIRSDGIIGKYNGLRGDKKALLIKEKAILK